MLQLSFPSGRRQTTTSKQIFFPTYTAHSRASLFFDYPYSFQTVFVVLARITLIALRDVASVFLLKYFATKHPKETEASPPWDCFQISLHTLLLPFNPTPHALWMASGIQTMTPPN